MNEGEVLAKVQKKLSKNECTGNQTGRETLLPA